MLVDIVIDVTQKKIDCHIHWSVMIKLKTYFIEIFGWFYYICHLIHLYNWLYCIALVYILKVDTDNLDNHVFIEALITLLYVLNLISNKLVWLLQQGSIISIPSIKYQDIKPTYLKLGCLISVETPDETAITGTLSWSWSWVIACGRVLLFSCSSLSCYVGMMCGKAVCSGWGSSCLWLVISVAATFDWRHL